MKILLRFHLQNNKLPIDYRRIMLSFFKRSLSDIAEGKYYEKYYFTPERRNFTFAVNLPMPKFSKTEIQLGKNQLNITFQQLTIIRDVFYVCFYKAKGQADSRSARQRNETCQC